MKKLIPAFLLVAAVLLSGCLFSTDCELSEKYERSRNVDTYDQENDEIVYRFSFSQLIKVYTSACPEKNINTTSLKVINLNDCKQIVDFTILFDYLTDSVTVTETGLVFEPHQEIDLGAVVYNGDHIDNTALTITLHASECQE